MADPVATPPDPPDEQEPSEQEDRKRRGLLWWIVGGAAAVAVLLLAWLLWPRPDEPAPPAPYTFDVNYDRTELVELVYELAFADLADAPPADPSPARPRLGYVYRPEHAKVFRYQGEGDLADGPLLLARKLHFLHTRHGDGWSDLVRGSGPLTWNPAESPDPKTAVGDVLTAIRVPVAVKVSLHDGAAVIATEAGEKTLSAGESAVVWTGSSSMALDDYLAQLRKLDPELPELTDPQLARARTWLNVGEDGKVQLFARLTAFARGPVELADVDLGRLRDDAVAAANRGEHEKARVLARTYANAYPEDETIWALVARVEQAEQAGESRIRLAGTVTLPPGGPKNGPPMRVAARSGDDPEGQWRASVVVTDGSWEMFLPPGRYQLRLDAPGYRTQTTELDPGSGSEWNVQLTENDKRD